MDVELAQAATVFYVLCVRLQRLWLLLMAVYRLVQVRSQNRSVPSRGGLYFKHNQLSLYVNLVCFDSIGSKDNLVE